MVSVFMVSNQLHFFRLVLIVYFFCAQECFNCPYGTKYFPEYCESVPSGPTTQMLAQEAKNNKIFLIGGSIPEKDEGRLFNTSLTFNPEGEIIAKHRKVGRLSFASISFGLIQLL